MRKVVTLSDVTPNVGHETTSTVAPTTTRDKSKTHDLLAALRPEMTTTIIEIATLTIQTPDRLAQHNNTRLKRPRYVLTQHQPKHLLSAGTIAEDKLHAPAISDHEMTTEVMMGGAKDAVVDEATCTQQMYLVVGTVRAMAGVQVLGGMEGRGAGTTWVWGKAWG